MTNDGPMDGETPAPAEPTTLSAGERAMDAAQRIVVERLELIRLELQDALARQVRRAGLVLAAGFIAILGWSGLAIALVLVLAEQMPLAASSALVGGVHVLGGLVLAVATAASGERRTS